jgi:hypothetical protein
LPIGDPQEPHEWERVELANLDLHDAEFFTDVWEPWRLDLLSSSYTALEDVKAVLQPRSPVCRLLAEAYLPGPVIQARFGIAADFVAPLPGCGHCPKCRALGIPPPDDPPPRIPSRWIVDQAAGDGLEALMAAAPTGERLALVVSGNPPSDAPRLATVLARSGVRFFAGVDAPRSSAMTAWFVDGPDVNPDDLPPVPCLIVPRPGASITQGWLVPGLRPPDAHGHPVPVVLLVSPGTLVGARRSPAENLRVLPIDTAMSVLRLAAT